MRSAKNPTPADLRIFKVSFLLFDVDALAPEYRHKEQHLYHFLDQSITLIRKDLATLRRHDSTIPESRFPNREKLFPTKSSLIAIPCFEIIGKREQSRNTNKPKVLSG